jgi:hypothetical protein
MALLGLLAVAVMVFAYVLTSRLNAASQFVALDREQSAKALGRAKLALVGYVAQQASLAAENNPGSLPCPEAPANFGTANEGIAAGNCTLPAVGRLPWRTLGLDRLVDAAGEPLWYVVSAGWALPCSTCTTVINSDSPGQITVDGAANAAVALIIAPGPAIAAQAGAGCTAWAQLRPAAGPPDLRNYLECGNAAGSFVTSSPGNTFNDQVLQVRTADVLPALEAAVADRMQREIAPALATAKFALDSSSPRRWVISSSNPPIYPFAAPFANPGTSLYRGQDGIYQGLIPFNQAQSFVAYQATPANAVETLGNGYIMSQTCDWDTADAYLCAGRYHEDDTDPTLPMRLQMTATFSNVAMGLRVLNTANLQVQAREDDTTGPWVNLTPSYQAEMNDGSVAGKPRGSVTVRFWATLPNIDVMGWFTYADFRIRIDRAVIGDHCLLSTTTSCPGPSTTWFARNEWYRSIYYAVAQNNTANVLPSIGGCGSTNCLRVNDPATRNIRALLVLAGRSLSNPAGRPNGTLSDYVEYQNADLGTMYEQRVARVSKVAISTPYYAPWNDRVILVDWDPASPPNAAQVVSLTPLRVVTLP